MHGAYTFFRPRPAAGFRAPLPPPLARLLCSGVQSCPLSSPPAPAPASEPSPLLSPLPSSLSAAPSPAPFLLPGPPVPRGLSASGSLSR
jgi:hypothetical protein